MKKTVKFFVMVLLATLLLAGCGDEASLQSEGNADISKLVKKEIRYDEYGTQTWKYTYDKKGLLIKEVCTYKSEDDKRETVTEYTYDADGKILSNVYMEGGYSDYLYYLYDESGRLIETNSGEDGQDSRLTREYDEHGNVICERLWYYGFVFETDYYKYYADGTLKKIEKYRKDETGLGEELRSSEEYDESGRVISRVEYAQENGEPVQMTKSTYVYSAEDNTVTTTIYDAEDNITEVTERMWNVEFPEYDENGRLVSKKVYYGKTTGDEADFYYLDTYEYDDAGNKVKETHQSYYYEDNGKIIYWKEYFY